MIFSHIQMFYAFAFQHVSFNLLKNFQRKYDRMFPLFTRISAKASLAKEILGWWRHSSLWQPMFVDEWQCSYRRLNPNIYHVPWRNKIQYTIHFRRSNRYEIYRAQQTLHMIIALTKYPLSEISFSMLFVRIEMTMVTLSNVFGDVTPQKVSALASSEHRLRRVNR